MNRSRWMGRAGLALLSAGVVSGQAMGGEVASADPAPPLPPGQVAAPASGTAPAAPSTAPAQGAPGTPAAPAATPLKTEPLRVEPFGYFFSRFERGVHYGSTAAPSADFARYRAQFGLRTRIPLEGGRSVQVRFAPQVGGFWNIGGDTLDDPSLGLHEAAVKLYGARGSIEVGRFEMSYGDELVIGAVGWHHIGRAFDGVRARINAGQSGAWVDVFATQLSEGTVGEIPTPSGDLAAQDRYFVGVYSGLGPLVGKVDLDVYGLSVMTPGYVAGESTVDGAAELTLGARVKGKAGLLDYRIEAGAQVGSRRVEAVSSDVLAFQGDAELGATLPVARGLRIGLEGFYAGGDDPDTGRNEAWNQLFPTAHKWLGLMDVIGPRTNVLGGALHLKLSPTDRWSLLLDAHQFYRPQPSEGTDRLAGTEIDTGLVYALSKAFTVRGAYDVYLQPGGAADPLLHFVELEVSSRF